MLNNEHEEHIHDENCECGHDHEHEHKHEHDENCECGHDHEHEHKHEHDENCECGHDHEHEHEHKHEHDENCECGHEHKHEHDENCECGHDHEHKHEHEHEEGTPMLDVYTHDAATIGALDITVPGTFEIAKDTINNLFAQLGAWVVESGGIIGHIKAFIEANGEGGMLSMTDDEVNFHHTADGSCKVNIASIVFMITPAQLEEKLSVLFAEYLK